MLAIRPIIQPGIDVSEFGWGGPQRQLEKKQMALISIVIPVYNEQECLPSLFERFDRLQASGPESYEFIFIDDGSLDQSRSIISELAQRHPNVKYVFFSRNFGHEMATTAGIDHATGDAVVIIDADLQDPPELIPELIAKWQQGYQVVFAQRRTRAGESIFKKFSSWLFYRIICRLSNVGIPPDTGDFRLMDRLAVEHFRRCREHSRFVRGLVAWTGFRQTAVLYDRDHRHGGQAKYGLFKLIVLAFDAVLGFSNVPLRIGIFLGLLICALSLVMAVVIFFQKLFWGLPVQGYALLATGMFFLGGIQLSMLGLLGEYIGRIYRESQRRPLYIIAEKSKSLPGGYDGAFTARDGDTADSPRATDG